MKLISLLLMMFLVGCASGKMGAITKPLDRTKITKETPFYIFPVTTKNTRFDGDKAQDQERTDSEKEVIAHRYHRKVISNLVAKGYTARKGTKKMTSGVAIKGSVSRFDHGSAAARSMVGMGAGASKMFTDFKAYDVKTNKLLGEFEVIATSGGRGGFAAMGSFMDAHIDDGAEQLAKYIDGKIK